MTRAPMTNTANGVLRSALGAVILLCFSTTAFAEDTCTLKGDVVMPKGLAISDSQGTDIAQFNGAKVTVSVSGFPSNGTRAKIQTSGFRIDGYVKSRDVPVYTARSVPVHMGHVCIVDGEGKTIFALGDPSTELVKAAEDGHADLIAMATHGHRFLADVVHGTTADRVRHLVKIPVLLLKAQ